jgi:hypothetical protein
MIELAKNAVVAFVRSIALSGSVQREGTIIRRIALS